MAYLNRYSYLDTFENLDPFENQVERAQNAVNNLTDEKQRIWFQKFLDILKIMHFARVTLKNGAHMDVQRIAHTSSWASFFDIYNIKHYLDFSIEPVEIEEMSGKNTYSNIKTMWNSK